ncbi:hypothetical protein [Spongiimicrobium sp. 2-473A-2-J]|uniref:hypothetical protein n=1 Tax=Eudoraea algarum TaxID=3417568 RepID=UPI003D35F1F0
MVKKFVVAIICCIAYNTYAQDGTVSPYSFFGIGELRSATTVENQMMGGIGLYADSIHINLRNPAAYGNLKLTTYTVGVSHREVRLKDFTTEEKTSVTNLDYLAIGLPLGKGFGLGFGILPLSSTGYNIVAETVDQNQDSVTTVFGGEGGINRVYLSLGYQLAKNLTIGATTNLNFGTLENRVIQSVQNVQFGTSDRRESRVNGLDFNFAANYTPTIKDKYTLFTSVRINTQANLTSENSQRIGSFNITNGQDIEVIDIDLDAQNLRNTELKIPTTTTLGLGFGEERKWFLGGEYSFQALSSFTNAFISIDNLEYQDASTMAFGGYYIPEYGSFTSYLKRITYRAGVRYEKTGMVLNNKEVNNFGITFGLGLPLGGNFSNLNIGFELGRRGTTAADLVEESYLKVNLGLSLNDKWFQKRKIN